LAAFLSSLQQNQSPTDSCKPLKHSPLHLVLGSELTVHTSYTHQRLEMLQ